MTDVPRDPRDYLDSLDDEPLKYALVQCGEAKQEEKHVLAKDLYTSNYFQKKAEYAEECCYSWSILSAKYGVITPYTNIDYYDVTLDDYPRDVEDGYRTLDEWSEAVEESLQDTFSYLFNHPAHPDDYELVVLASQEYIDEIWIELGQVEFMRSNVELRFPFEDLGGIPGQMRWMQARIDEATDDPNQMRFGDVSS